MPGFNQCLSNLAYLSFSGIASRDTLSILRK